ncbi:kinase-like domain-containing protein [Rhizophagus diaphanus]|nr:kinase-like domain-containing protein [Rhizophagus diaphanus] [Rhizophagus sp. MUCL 43196]
MSNNPEIKVISNSNEWINWIEESIVKKQIKCYDQNHFNNIQEIGSGNFGRVYRANWKNSHGFLALKSFINFDAIAKEIVNELKLQREIDFHENIIRFYGITTEIQSDNSKKYLLVMEYADSGTLRNYLSERFENLTWNDKLNLAFQLADAISYLHKKGIMHHDLHSKNILVHKNIIKLADFGLSKRIKGLLNFQSNLYEMVAYVDPQIFNRKSSNDSVQVVYSLNIKSDVYSIGILLWEISSGQPPFCNEPHDFSLAIEILQGLREKPITSTPENYVKIYTGKFKLLSTNIILINFKLILYLDCWNNDPDDRPTINQVVEKLNAIIQKEDIQVPNKQENVLKFHENIINNSLYGKMSQIIQNFSKINIKEIEPSISSNLIMNDFKIIITEIIFLLENIESERKKHEVINYLNDHNLTSQEIYNWLLNNQDNSNSVFLLGVFNHVGIEINVDEQKAFELYQKAANAGNSSGIISLGYCYHYGIGTSIDNLKAFELYQEAASLGNSRGIYNLGVCYNNGIGTIVNNNKAFKLFQESANLGNPLGISSLGYCYGNGIGTSINNQKAFELYQIAANSGNILGITSLAYCYEKGIETNVNKQKAFELYQIAANLGSMFAQYCLAFMYESGKGVKKDINQAIYWYKKCAEQGDLDAQDKLLALIG